MSYKVNPIVFANEVSCGDSLKEFLLGTFSNIADPKFNFYSGTLTTNFNIKIKDKKEKFYEAMFIDDWFPLGDFGTIEIFGLKFEYIIKSVKNDSVEFNVSLLNISPKEAIDKIILYK